MFTSIYKIVKNYIISPFLLFKIIFKQHLTTFERQSIMVYFVCGVEV